MRQCTGSDGRVACTCSTRFWCTIRRLGVKGLAADVVLAILTHVIYPVGVPLLVLQARRDLGRNPKAKAFRQHRFYFHVSALCQLLVFGLLDVDDLDACNQFVDVREVEEGKDGTEVNEG